MNKRIDKIQFLKGLIKGSRNINEIQHPAVILCIGAGGSTYEYKKTGKLLTEEEISRFKEVLKKESNIKFNVQHEITNKVRKNKIIERPAKRRKKN